MGRLRKMRRSRRVSRRLHGPSGGAAESGTEDSSGRLWVLDLLYTFKAVPERVLRVEAAVAGQLGVGPDGEARRCQAGAQRLQVVRAQGRVPAARGHLVLHAAVELLGAAREPDA